MLTEPDVKEELSHAYVHAVAASLGWAYERTQNDRDSIDATIKAKGFVGDATALFSPSLGVQLKASSVLSPADGELHFALPVKNYDDLREESRQVPAILVVLVLPEERAEWLHWTAEELVARRCAYWHTLVGAPATNNTETKTVHISMRNVFSPDALRTLMTIVSQGEAIPNEL